MKTSLACAAVALLCLAGCANRVCVLSEIGPVAMDPNALRAAGLPDRMDVHEPRGAVIGSVDLTTAFSRKEVKFGDDRITVCTHPITWNEAKWENLDYCPVSKDRLRFDGLLSLRGCGPITIWQGKKCLACMAGKVHWVLAGNNLTQAVLFTQYQRRVADGPFEVQVAALAPREKAVGLNMVWLDFTPEGFHYTCVISAETDQDRPRMIRFIANDWSDNPHKATLILNETGGYDWPKEEIIAPPIRLPSDTPESKKF